MGGLRAFLRGAAVFAGALAAVTAAFLAGTFGYSLVACHGGGEDAALWALIMVAEIFLGVPGWTAMYVLMVLGVALFARAALARLGVARVLGAIVLLLAVVMATTAGVKAMSSDSGGCSILGAAAVARFS